MVMSQDNLRIQSHTAMSPIWGNRMDTQTILRFMSEPATQPPIARHLAVTYAYLLDSISDRLEPGELESFIAIGVALT